MSEKSIRHYEEWGLIEPDKNEYNGRYFRDYSENDIKMLETIAVLRRARFSIEQIRMMQNSPEDIPEIVAGLRGELKAEYSRLSELVARLDELQGDIDDINELSEHLRASASALPLPGRDVSLNFGRFDPETKEEKLRQYENFEKNFSKYERSRKMGSVWEFIMKLAVWAMIAGAIIGAVYAVGTKLPFLKTVNCQLDAVEWIDGDGDYAVERSISLRGEKQSYIFGNDRFDGYLTISGYDYTKEDPVVIYILKDYSTCSWYHNGKTESVTIVHSGNFKQLVIFMDQSEGKAITANVHTRAHALEETERLSKKYSPRFYAALQWK